MKKLWFRVHGSTVSVGRWPSISQAGRIDGRFTRTGGYLFLFAQLAFGLGCPAGLSQGRLQGHPGRAQNAKVVFGVGESTLFPESRCFAYTGAPALHTTLAVRPGQLAKLCAPVRPAGCLVGACSTSFVSQVGVLRRRDANLESNVAFIVPPTPRLGGMIRCRKNVFGVSETPLFKKNVRFM